MNDIHNAAIKGDIPKLQFLILAGEDVNKEDIWKTTPLHYAIQCNRKDAMLFLLENGAIIETGHKRMQSNTLWYAVTTGNYEILKLLLQRGEEIRHSFMEQPFLFDACRYSYKITKYILNKLYKQYDKGNESKKLSQLLNVGSNRNPMIGAALNNDIPNVSKIWELLISKGANINAQNEEGATSLHITVASKNRNRDLLCWLLSHGADVNIRSNSGKTPLDIVVSCGIGTLQIASLLCSNGAVVDSSIIDASERAHLVYSQYPLIGFLYLKYLEYYYSDFCLPKNDGENVYDCIKKWKTAIRDIISAHDRIFTLSLFQKIK